MIHKVNSNTSFSEICEGMAEIWGKQAYWIIKPSSSYGVQKYKIRARRKKYDCELKYFVVKGSTFKGCKPSWILSYALNIATHLQKPRTIILKVIASSRTTTVANS